MVDSPSGHTPMITPAHYGPCGVILGRLRVRRAHDESESNPSTISMHRMETQGRDNSDSACTAQSQHTASHIIILDSPSPTNQTARLRGEHEDDDMTASHNDQDDWSIENLPDILYILKPEHGKSRHVVRTTAHKIFGKHINAFSVLPDQISSKIEGWRLEAWMRLDRRITGQDIIDRVNPRYRPRLTSIDIELRRKAFRERFHVACWGAQKTINNISRLAVSRGIDPASNTTRGLTPGLIDPSKGEAGGRIPLPPRAAYDSISDSISHAGHSDSDILEQAHLVTQSSHPGHIPTVILDEPQRSHKTKPAEFIYQLHWDTKHLRKKGVPNSDHFRLTDSYLERPSFNYSARRDRISIQQYPSDFNSYPATLRELASHGGPPARSFSTETEDTERTMSLDDYLHGSQLTFWEYLDRRYENSLRDIKRLSLRPRR
ncbi:hypothetical protein ABOM_001121 [Aspergillus bombycis]|uniref:Uncharacterized protein n=1 Tax=Aspergillus bombycis TaxID=109264 RepID=A0A1F8AEV1_9EURO|nr:hypothetical protein ABOM_001121 [Aspergillus bombycis]OGM50254.1 hypothetical protein ABOM_001121 [Aspergillus bombycis]